MLLGVSANNLLAACTLLESITNRTVCDSTERARLEYLASYKKIGRLFTDLSPMASGPISLFPVAGCFTCADRFRNPAARGVACPLLDTSLSVSREASGL